MNIGDFVWWPHIKTCEQRTTCPDCFGKLKLTVILGDDSRVEIDCANCASGYDPPRGYVTYRESKAIAEKVLIERIEEDGSGKTYGFNGCYRTTDIFPSEAEAQVRAEEISAEYNQEQLDKMQRKERDAHSWAWHVTYHRRCVKQATKDLEYHSAKLKIAQTKFRSREERERDKCLNCGAELYDDDDPTPYERGYCRGCQRPPSSEKIDLIIGMWEDIGRLFKVRK